MALGIIAAAGLAGVAANNYVFNYTKDAYEQRINELQSYITKLQDHKKNLEDLRSGISEFWDDENARKTSRLLLEQLGEIERYNEWAEETVRDLQLVVQELDGDKNVLSQLIDDLTDATSALGG